MCIFVTIYKNYKYHIAVKRTKKPLISIVVFQRVIYQVTKKDENGTKSGFFDFIEFFKKVKHPCYTI